MAPQINLQPGSTNTQAVKQLQDYLVSQGVMTQAQVNTGYGTYGPQTKAAVAALQQRLGVNAGTDAGYYGPLTISAISKTNGAPSGNDQVNSNVARAAALGVTIPGVSGATNAAPKTQAELDAAYATAAASHPALAGNSADAINYATSTGDYSQLVNAQGQPFSAADQASALSDATAVVSPYYQAEQLKDTQDTTSSLASKQASYNKFLDTEATNFQTEKTNQDQNAADSGVLFSGGRAQKLQQLGDTYTKNNAYELATAGADIGNTARDFGYKYGDTTANSLSSYYNLSKNTYNPNVATGGVTSGGLSSVYNANQGFQGTEVNAAKTAAQQRAAALLANKGNKLLATGYTNQF